MSRLRARCPDCRTLTAVALGPDYECHSCGRAFAAGLVRVPRAWGNGGDAMIQAASLPLSYPEAAVIEEGTLGEQTLAIASALPERPLVLGGCCCSHVGAIEGLAARHERLGVVWLDAHGDLNTPQSSPSGNLWGMPLRMVLDAGMVAAEVGTSSGRRITRPYEASASSSTATYCWSRRRRSTAPSGRCLPQPTWPDCGRGVGGGGPPLICSAVQGQPWQELLSTQRRSRG